MTLFEKIVYLAFGATVFYLLFRLMLAAHFAAKRRYMRRLMHDLHSGEHNGQ
jgi:hypothetical protein